MKKFILSSIFSICAFANTGHYLSLGYDLTTIAKFEDTFITDGTNSARDIDVDYKFESGIAIAYEYRNSQKNRFGFSTGFDYRPNKKIEELEIDGTTFKASGSDVASISIVQLYINAIYKWDIFYIPFGINYMSVNYTPPNSYSGSTEATGGIGINFGLGWELGDKFLLEYAVKSSSFSLENSDGSNKSEYKDGALASSTLWLRYKLF